MGEEKPLGLSLLMPLGGGHKDIAVLLVLCLVLEWGPGHSNTSLLLLRANSVIDSAWVVHWELGCLGTSLLYCW